ncbi:MAG: hypothetical protein KGR26_16695, partial [Cyanobacteria bacterium REEB65]|nr:hypothetical protein [Cyanobacteria bacterium REEB65]
MATKAKVKAPPKGKTTAVAKVPTPAEEEASARKRAEWMVGFLAERLSGAGHTVTHDAHDGIFAIDHVPVVVKPRIQGSYLANTLKPRIDVIYDASTERYVEPAKGFNADRLFNVVEDTLSRAAVHWAAIQARESAKRQREEAATQALTAVDAALLRFKEAYELGDRTYYWPIQQGRCDGI